MRPEPDFSTIVPHFQFQGEFLHAEPYGFGHINDTYAAYFRLADGALRRYIMQRINHFVFKNPPELMANIAAVMLLDPQNRQYYSIPMFIGSAAPVLISLYLIIRARRFGLLLMRLNRREVRARG